MGRKPVIPLVILLSLSLALAGCRRAEPGATEGRLRVVATTTIVGDVVSRVGGNAIALTVLLPAGADPHAFEPTPQDIARVTQAAVVFANGAGLEAFLDSLLKNAGGGAEMVRVSEGVALREFAPQEEAGHEEEHEREGVDPHVWTDPNNVIVWTRNIEAALARLDPENAGRYRANAEAYRGELQALDAWVRDQVAQIPQANRKLVTDHLVFGYLADRYGFEQIGAVMPGFTTLADPSSQELAALVDVIRRHGVRAIFVGATVNPNLARRVSEDTGARLVSLYTGSLTAPGGDADSYLQYMRYNVSALVEALK